jgi:hypothetical protein
MAPLFSPMLGPEAANPPVGPEPHSGMHFVQPGGEPVRHLGILLSATEGGSLSADVCETTGCCQAACALVEYA